GRERARGDGLSRGDARILQRKDGEAVARRRHCGWGVHQTGGNSDEQDTSNHDSSTGNGSAVSIRRGPCNTVYSDWASNTAGQYPASSAVPLGFPVNLRTGVASASAGNHLEI